MKADLILKSEAPSGCEIHKDCDAVILNLHHSPPKSWHPTSPKVHSLCPTAHVNVHYAIDRLVRGRPIGRLVGWKVRDLAREALRMAKEQGLTPRPTL